MKLLRLLLACCAPAAVALAGTSASNPKPADGDFILPMPNGLEMVFRPVYLGVGDGPLAVREMMMGGRAGEGFREMPTKVRLGGAFIGDNAGKRDWLYYIGKYEVTEQQFASVGASSAGGAVGDRAAMPKVNVTYLEVEQFLQAYNLWLFANARAQLPKQADAVAFVRLPTEAEWEFAARGGSAVDNDLFDQRTPYRGELARHEWFGGARSSHDKLKAIGLLDPNPLGIHDLLGNAAELVSHHYQIEYIQGRAGGMIIRGGNFRTPEQDLRSSLRTEQPFYSPDFQPARSETTGFRLVLASTIFTSPQTSRSIEAAWPAYLATRVAPMAAALTTASVATQTTASLRDVDGILAQLEESLGGRGAVPEGAQAKINLLRSAFGDIESNIRNAEQDFAEGNVKQDSIASYLAWRSLGFIPKVKARLARAANAADRELDQRDLADYEANLADARRAHSDACRRLARISPEIVEKAYDQWLAELKTRNIPDQTHATEVAKQNALDYCRTKRLDLDSWLSALAPAGGPAIRR